MSEAGSRIYRKLQVKDIDVSPFCLTPSVERNKQMARLASLIADILTVTAEQAEQLLKQYPQDAEDLYNALIFAPRTSSVEGGLAETVSRKWRSTTMALLPKSDLISFEDFNFDAFLVKQDTLGNRASLRHVSLQKLDYGEGFDPAQDRVALLKELRSKLPTSLREQFKPLLLLLSESKNSLTKRRLEAYPHSDDLCTLLLIDFVEQEFNTRKQDAERKLRRLHGYPETSPTPPKHFATLAETAYKQTLTATATASVSLHYADFTRQEPGYLILMVMFNICANRQLLERARQQALAAVGWDANQKFLRALDRAGIRELNTFEFSGRNPRWAPGHPLFASFQNCSDVSLDDYVAALDGRSLIECTKAGLVAQFGPSSQWSKTTGCRPLCDYDLDWVMRLAEINHQNYLQTRLQGRDPVYITWYIAVMAVMACWHSKPYVQKIQAPSDRQTRAFPARNAGTEWTPTAEHRVLYAVMTGQLLFGNAGLTLNADTVAEYVKAQEYYHAATQGLLSKVFKQGSPLVLLRFAGKLRLAMSKRS